MFGTIIRVVIVYLIVLLVIRLMGKRQIGQMQPFELVITLIIADLATIPMSERTIPLISGVVPVLTLLIIHFVIAFFTKKSMRFRKLINGTPVIIINPNGIVFENMKQLNMNIDDLQELMRGASCQNLAEIQYAIIETNGNFNVIKKAASSPVSVADLKINKQENELAVVLVSDGRLLTKNLEMFNLKENNVLEMIKQTSKNKLKLKDVFYLSFDINGNVFLQPKKDKCISSIYKCPVGEFKRWLKEF